MQCLRHAWGGVQGGYSLQFSSAELRQHTKGGMSLFGEDQDQCGQARGRPAARYADRHVCVGGVDQPETTTRPAAVINAHRKCAQEAVRAGVDKQWCGTCPLNARHVPELF